MNITLIILFFIVFWCGVFTEKERMARKIKKTVLNVETVTLTQEEADELIGIVRESVKQDDR